MSGNGDLGSEDPGNQKHGQAPLVSALRRLVLGSRNLPGKAVDASPTYYLKRVVAPAAAAGLLLAATFGTIEGVQHGPIGLPAGSNLRCGPGEQYSGVPATTPSAPIPTMSWLDPAYSTYGAPVSPKSQTTFRMDLYLRNQKGAEALARAISDPASPDYRRYLTPQQFHECFAPNDSEVQLLADYYGQRGITLNTYSTPGNRSYLEFTGSAADLNKAFGIQLYNFNLGPIQQGGPDVYYQLPLGQPQMPEEFGKFVATENGLDQITMGKKDLNLPVLKLDPSIPNPAILSKPSMLPAGLTVQKVIDENNTPAGALNAHLRAIMHSDVGARVGIKFDGKSNSLKANPAVSSGGTPPPPAYVTDPADCSQYWGQVPADKLPPAVPGGPTVPLVVCGYTPQQLQQAYGADKWIKAGIDGRGVRVAIIDAGDSPTILNDINTYFASQGLPALKPGQFVDNGNATIRSEPDAPWGLSGWQLEQGLDIEAVHSLAPGATIIYQPAATPNDIDMQQALNTIIDNHSADIISNSWSTLGEIPPQEATPYENDFIQAATEGISVLFASGDSRDNLPNGFVGPDYQSTSPWVTAVGGTSLGIGPNGERLWETPWGTAQVGLGQHGWNGASTFADSGAGGGTSIIFPEPWYQTLPGPNGQPTVVPQMENSFGLQLAVSPDGYITGATVRYMRSATDVSMDADPNTGFLMGVTQTFPDGTEHYAPLRIGGTSQATPTFAGMLALADQHQGVLGFVNPALYRLDSKDPSAFFDAKGQDQPIVGARVNYANGVDSSEGYTYSLRFMGYDWTLYSTPGYDQPTGIGTPTGKMVDELGIG